MFSAPAPHLGGGGAPPGPLNPSQLRLGGGADTRGGKGKFLHHLQNKLQEIQIEAAEILSTAIRSDRDASEMSQRAEDVKRMTATLDSNLNTEADRWRTDDDVVSHLYGLRASLWDIQEHLAKNVRRILRDRGMQTGDADRADGDQQQGDEGLLHVPENRAPET